MSAELTVKYPLNRTFFQVASIFQSTSDSFVPTGAIGASGKANQCRDSGLIVAVLINVAKGAPNLLIIGHFSTAIPQRVNTFGKIGAC
jgi:hypothetical protein